MGGQGESTLSYSPVVKSNKLSIGLSVRTSKALQRPFPFISLKAEVAELGEDPTWGGGGRHEIESTKKSESTNHENKNEWRTPVLTFYTFMCNKNN